MKWFIGLLLLTMLSLGNSGCSDAVKDPFPKRQFVGYIDLRLPEYSERVFTVRRDMDRTLMGNNGLVVYQSGNEYFVFDLMCPHEIKFSCSVRVFPEDDPSVAECQCCGSRFLIANPYGSVIEGPAQRNLKKYEASVTQDQILVVRSY